MENKCLNKLIVINMMFLISVLSFSCEIGSLEVADDETKVCSPEPILLPISDYSKTYVPTHLNKLIFESEHGEEIEFTKFSDVSGHKSISEDIFCEFHLPPYFLEVDKEFLETSFTSGDSIFIHYYITKHIAARLNDQIYFCDFIEVTYSDNSTGFSCSNGGTLQCNEEMGKVGMQYSMASVGGVYDREVICEDLTFYDVFKFGRCHVNEETELNGWFSLAKDVGMIFYNDENRTLWHLESWE